MKKQLIYLSIIALALTFGCKKSRYPGYESTKDGLYFKIERGGSSKELPKEGDVLTLEMSYYLHDNDSILFDGKSFAQPIELPVQSPLFKGDINEGLFMITEGDKASFIVKADSFLIHNVGMTQMPPFIKPESMLRFEMKILKHKTQEEYMQEAKLRQEQQQLLLQDFKVKETPEREEYLKNNKITVKPTAEGLYFTLIKKGNGPKVETGDLVSAHYTGYFLNGDIFDSSENSPSPFQFIAGKGDVIKGWDLAVVMMRKGDKAKIVIPSDLAYGESRPDFPIPPYSSLVFDIEIVDVEKTDNKVR